MKNKLFITCLMLFFLVSCSNTLNEKYAPSKSFLQESPNKVVNKSSDSSVQAMDENASSTLNLQTSNFKYVNGLSANQKVSVKEDLSSKFSVEESIQVAVDELTIEDFVHYIYGQLLKVNYVLGDKVQADKKTITLNLQEKISLQRLFVLSEELLSQKGYLIGFEDGVFFIHKNDQKGGSGDIAYGYGNNVEDVPNTSIDIIQLVPFTYGVQSQIADVFKSIAKVSVTYNQRHDAFIIRGKRREIIRSLEFLSLMDQPSYLNRKIGIYKSAFVPLENITTKVPELLKQEGITVSKDGSSNTAITMVSLDVINAVVIFANTQTLLERTLFWAKEIDKPAAGTDRQYFVYQPEYSRATDLGESINALLGNGTSNSSNETSAANEDRQVKQRRTNNITSSGIAGDKNIRIVVDERANSIIFDTTGDEYRKILPLIKRLDVSPKQVILEVFIAEVTLTDEFKQGVEFALSKGSYGISNKGAFGIEDFGGLSYLLQGNNVNVALNLFASNSLVNVLSRPTLVVRDGVAASINVGSSIPVIGETKQDPLNSSSSQVTKIEYRQTGVDLTVTPTINAQGIVIMEINQSISNEIDGGSTVAGSPSIFERSIKTEVVAESGQTIILGGLISENKSKVATKVPVLGDIPLLGKLFRADKDTGNKTELVVMVTPKVIESASEWQAIKAKFTHSMENILISN